MHQCYVSSTTARSTKINLGNVDTANSYVLCKILPLVIPRGPLAYGGATGHRIWTVVIQKVQK